jgi:uncharacterized alpha-E superfamily protein
MLSRVADAIHWMSRYIERAENTARFVGVNEALTLDLPGNRGFQWSSLIAATGDDARFKERHVGFDRRQVMHFLMFDRGYPNSICSCLHAARENARSIREIISSDLWEQINRAYHYVKNAGHRVDSILDDPEGFLQNIKASCYRVHGSAQVTMTHDDAWLFMQLGRMLERADKTSRIVDVKYFLLHPEHRSRFRISGTEDDLQWSALLQSVSGLEMYRRRYGLLDPSQVLNFLLFEPHFPRSVRFCVTRAEQALQRLDIGGGDHPRNQAERRLGRLRAQLEFAEVSEVVERGLHHWVDDFQTALNGVGVCIHDTFFSMGGATQHQSQSQ